MAEPKWMQHRHVMHFRRRATGVDIAFQVVAGFREHRSSRMAAALTYYGFLSLFPLLLVFTTILGFVLENDPDLQESIVDSVIAKIPLIGDQLLQDPTSLEGNVIALVSGLALALWSGMKAFVGLQSAFDDIADQSLDGRSNLPKTRARALLAIVIVGVSQVATAIITSLGTFSDFPVVGRLLLVLAATAISIVVLVMILRWLRSVRPPWRDVLPGAVLGGIGFSVLQLLGATVIGRAIANAGAVYGTFASVIGLMAFISFHVWITLSAAELNQVLLLRSAGDSDSHTGEVA